MNKYTRRQKNMTIYLMDRHVEALNKLAEFQGISMSAVVRKLIDKAVKYLK